MVSLRRWMGLLRAPSLDIMIHYPQVEWRKATTQDARQVLTMARSDTAGINLAHIRIVRGGDRWSHRVSGIRKPVLSQRLPSVTITRQNRQRGNCLGAQTSYRSQR